MPIYYIWSVYTHPSTPSPLQPPSASNPRKGEGVALQCTSVNLRTNHQSTLKLQLQRFRVDDKIIAPWILLPRELRCHATPTHTRNPSVGPHLLATELIYLALRQLQQQRIVIGHQLLSIIYKCK